MNRGSTKTKKKSVQKNVVENNKNAKAANGKCAANKGKENNANGHVATKAPKGGTTGHERKLSDPNVSTVQQHKAPPKMERSHTSFFTRKLSKLYNQITSSKESLNKILESDDEHLHAMPKLTRSLSMAAIPIRQSFRRVFRESKLEKLHEEHGPEKAEDANEPEVAPAKEVPVKRRCVSTKERPTSLISSLKQALSGAVAEKPKELNPRWSASLLSLQNIDIMVSYEDLSFINYDKFNTIEKQIETRTRKLSAPVIQANNNYNNNTVVYRKKKGVPKVSGTLVTDVDSNFDQSRNLYRQSLDDRKLQFLNKFNRNSFRLSAKFDPSAEDVLQLDKCSNDNVFRSVDRFSELSKSDEKQTVLNKSDLDINYINRQRKIDVILVSFIYK